ncbi:MAG: glycosyltransferase [Ferruginibacter sp.]
MKVLKITIGEWHHENRDKRELSLLKELGAEVLVMAKGKIGDSFKKDIVEGFQVFRFSTRPLGNKSSLIPFNRFITIFIWAYKARKFRANIISGHDLLALFIGWLSNIGNISKVKFVYDSHEFELGRNQKRSKLNYWFIKNLEGFLIKRCAFSIMVNDSIADEISKIHHLAKRPLVIRSTPPNWKIDNEKCLKMRRYYLDTLGVKDDCFICMYHGRITGNRGIEELIEIISRTENTAGIILGDGVPEYILDLKELSMKLNVRNKILFLPAVEIEELVNYLGASDCGVIALRIIYKSYYYALPNKFFENIQSLTPIICNDTPEMARIVSQYNIGMTIDPPGSVEAAVQSVTRLSTDKALYRSFKTNMVKAKNDLCWEKEKERLAEAYNNILYSTVGT